MHRDHDLHAASDHEFQELRRVFLREALLRSREMQGLLAGGRNLPEAAEGLQFRKLAHDLRGTGGSYGFPIVSLYAGEAEDTYLERGHPEALLAIVGMLEGAVKQAASLVGEPGEASGGGRAKRA